MSTKVFVGNLVFSTTDEQLKNAFAGSANVVSANIITRGRRSLGYGFVEFASEEEAEKAVTAMHKKEVEGRAINVELARPRDAAKEAEARERAEARAANPSTRQPRRPRNNKTANGEEGAVVGSEEGAAVSSPAGGRAAGASGQRRRRNNKRNGKSSNGGVAENGTAATGASPATAGDRKAARRPRQPRPKREVDANRELSQTTLFVANVPFSTDDEQLKSYFAEHNPKAAHVVRMRNGRSRGYGFVEFDSAEQQLSASKAVDGKEVPIQSGGNLKLSVKIALANRVTSPDSLPLDATTTPTPAQ